jgi:hypothetical protein
MRRIERQENMFESNSTESAEFLVCLKFRHASRDYTADVWADGSFHIRGDGGISEGRIGSVGITKSIVKRQSIEVSDSAIRDMRSRFVAWMKHHGYKAFRVRVNNQVDLSWWYARDSYEARKFVGISLRNVEIKEP